MTTRLTIPPPRPLSIEQHARLRQALIEEFRRPRQTQAGWRWPRRRLILLATVVAVAAVAAGAYGAYLLTRPPADHITVGCYQRVSLQSNVKVLATEGRSPTAVCGSVEHGSPSNGHSTSGSPMAQLQACLLPSGAIGVFPAADACARLHLTPFSPSEEAQRQARLFAKLQNALSAAFLGRCLDEHDAQASARTILDSHGYSDWKIRTPQPFTAVRRCGSFAFDEPHRTLTLIGVPHP